MTETSTCAWNIGKYFSMTSSGKNGTDSERRSSSRWMSGKSSWEEMRCERGGGRLTVGAGDDDDFALGVRLGALAEEQLHVADDGDAGIT